MSDTDKTDLIELTADLASAHLSNNTIQPSEVPELIRAIHAALAGLGQKPDPDPSATVRTGAVSARKSLASTEHIISMIDGKPYRTLKRHVTRHGYTPESYRAAFGLPDSYPMVAPAYSETRKSLAKAAGLGRTAKDAVEPVAAKVKGGLKAAIASAREHLGTEEKPRRGRKPADEADD